MRTFGGKGEWPFAVLLNVDTFVPIGAETRYGKLRLVALVMVSRWP